MRWKVRQHKIMDCDFPNYNANMTCNSSINYGRVPFTVPKVGDASDTVMKKLRTSGERTIGRDIENMFLEKKVSIHLFGL